LGSFCDGIEIRIPDPTGADEVLALFPEATCRVLESSATCATLCAIPRPFSEEEAWTIGEPVYEKLCAAVGIDPKAQVICTVLE